MKSSGISRKKPEQNSDFFTYPEKKIWKFKKNINSDIKFPDFDSSALVDKYFQISENQNMQLSSKPNIYLGECI